MPGDEDHDDLRRQPGALPQAPLFTANIDSHITPTISGGILEMDAYSGGVNSRPGYYRGQNRVLLLDSFAMAADPQIAHSTQNART